MVSGGAATFTTPFPGLARSGTPQTREIDAQMSRVFSNAHHYVVFDASPHALAVQAHRTRAGNLRPPGIFDEFTLSKKSMVCRP